MVIESESTLAAQTTDIEQPAIIQPVEPYPQLIERIDQWPIYKLSQDRKHFIEEINEFTIERLVHQNPKIRDLIAETVYFEKNRVRENPWKVDPPNEAQFWNKILSRLLKIEKEEKKQAAESYKELLHKIVNRYSTEIVGTFNIAAFRFARKFLTVFFNRLLNAAIERWWRFLSSRNTIFERIQVFGDVDKIRSLFNQGVVVVVPTHFSNLDSILIGFAMDQVMGLPSFSYGAGLNLYNSGLPAFFMNRLGAYRVDRRKKNDIYLETLKTMSMLSIKRGTNSLFFPGGTRSRSGEVETRLKMGLLGTAVEAQRALAQEGKPQKVFIVPLVVSYHFVLEAPYLIQQHLQITGKEKYIKGRSEGNSLREWFKFVWQFFSKKSDIILSFGKPMDVMGNFVDADGTSRDARGVATDVKDYFTTEGGVSQNLQREAEYTKMLADKIVDRFHKENIVLSSHVVAFTAFNMLKNSFEKLDLYALLRLQPDDYIFSKSTFTAAVGELQTVLFDFNKKGRLKLSEALYQSPEDLVKDGLKNLGIYHVRKPLTFNKKGDIESDDFNVLFYYHNRLEHFGLTKRVKWERYKIDIKTED